MSDTSPRIVGAESETAAWYQALTLIERLGHTPRATDGIGGPAVDREAFGADLTSATESASKRLARWRSQPPFATTSLFAERLADDNVTEMELLQILSELPEELGRRNGLRPRYSRVQRSRSCKSRRPV